jgi:hypothetical protein
VDFTTRNTKTRFGHGFIEWELRFTRAAEYRLF